MAYLFEMVIDCTCWWAEMLVWTMDVWMTLRQVMDGPLDTGGFMEGWVLGLIDYG